jgi:hypothetical protein
MNLKMLGRRSATTLLAGLIVVLACDGENLFDPDQNPFLEPSVVVSAPASAFAGDTIDISIEANASGSVARIDVSFTGAVTRDTAIIPTPAAEISTILEAALPLKLPTRC